MEEVVAGIRKMTASFGAVRESSRSKHTAGHAGEKRRRKERTRAKNRTAKLSRRQSR